MYRSYFLNITEFKEKHSYEEIYKQVSSYRKKKADRLIFEKDKWLSIGAEYLLMQALNEKDINYSKIEIELKNNDKPYIKNDDINLYYNLSHSEEMVMCTISDHEIGCDIQKILKKKRYMEIAENFFHPKEIELIKNTAEGDRLNMFYRLWVLKESYIKCTGKGLSTSLKSFYILFKNDKPNIFLNDKLCENYYFEEVEPHNESYRSAICMNKN